jgi:hypothetical protein
MSRRRQAKLLSRYLVFPFTVAVQAVLHSVRGSATSLGLLNMSHPKHLRSTPPPKKVRQLPPPRGAKEPGDADMEARQE